MSSTRQDAWTHDEDLLLAELVLRHIREGGTQLQAFEKVGKKLSRTAAACGFRWNSYVRKQYKSGIELAKKQRKERKHNPQAEEAGNFEENDEVATNLEVPAENSNGIDKPLEFEDLISYLKKLYSKAEESSSQSEDLKTNEARIQQLEKQLYYLASENERLIKELNSIEKDYKSLIEIMERARKMVAIKNEDSQQKI
ncbi:RsfA family transcriptional regulator [Bacillus sp. DTU_2020_1000418_1_SI_GHA_SEK_038]|uniref:RsfA family transcriptional regulator n=1 Tax=Bacillus sp. DTU_2020_1000418_1_SI_GHA_SEK_038 TaxID=3077585 RepID=UPI0028EB5A33|nr:RsfA family transcriptional regulator [Bacillus sp. DTU_2020_1000418_1_SI_GHA_SEK_038]WNS77068.1 RsfA family transcriptional regulator [Bacillus sp. DTU_2020_1000418_1_SI_GHA_SEK_038]